MSERSPARAAESRQPRGIVPGRAIEEGDGLAFDILLVETGEGAAKAAPRAEGR